MQRHRCRGQCRVVWHLESDIQCVRVCRRASEMLQRCIGEGLEFDTQGHTLTYGSYAYKYISKVKHNLRLLSKLGTTYVSSHHPTTQPPAPNQYYLWCLVAPPFDIKSHKIQTNKEPRDEESASCMQ